MPYRVAMHGVVVSCDTPDEVRLLLPPPSTLREAINVELSAPAPGKPKKRLTATPKGTLAPWPKGKPKNKAQSLAAAAKLKSKTCTACKATFQTEEGRQRRCRDCRGLTKDQDVPLAAATAHKH